MTRVPSADIRARLGRPTRSCRSTASSFRSSIDNPYVCTTPRLANTQTPFDLGGVRALATRPQDGPRAARLGQRHGGQPTLVGPQRIVAEDDVRFGQHLRCVGGRGRGHPRDRGQALGACVDEIPHRQSEQDHGADRDQDDLRATHRALTAESCRALRKTNPASTREISSSPAISHRAGVRPPNCHRMPNPPTRRNGPARRRSGPRRCRWPGSPRAHSGWPAPPGRRPWRRRRPPAARAPPRPTAARPVAGREHVHAEEHPVSGDEDQAPAHPVSQAAHRHGQQQVSGVGPDEEQREVGRGRVIRRRRARDR